MRPLRFSATASWSRQRRKNASCGSSTTSVFPERAIRFCLESAGIHGADLDDVAFFEKPFVKFDRIVHSVFAAVPRSGAVFRAAMTAWLLDKLWVKNRLRAALGIPADRILFVEHHESHAASTFLCSRSRRPRS